MESTALQVIVARWFIQSIIHQLQIQYAAFFYSRKGLRQKTTLDKLTFILKNSIQEIKIFLTILRCIKQTSPLNAPATTNVDWCLGYSELKLCFVTRNGKNNHLKTQRGSLKKENSTESRHQPGEYSISFFLQAFPIQLSLLSSWPIFSPKRKHGPR